MAAVRLKDARQRERQAKAKPTGALVPLTLDGAALAREIAGAVRAAHGSSLLSDQERDALVQSVAVYVLRKSARERVGSAREVIAWIDRAERFPAWAARADQIDRGSVGRESLRQTVEYLMRDSREWRDTAASFKARERADRERNGPAITLESWEVLAADEAGSAITLDAAIAREAANRPTVERAALPAASEELCAAWSESLGLSDAQARYVECALLSEAAGVPADVIAHRFGKSLRHVLSDCNRGRTLLRAIYPTSLEMLEAGRAVASECGLLERDLERDVPTLGADEADALAHVERAKRAERDLATRHRVMPMVGGPGSGSARDVLAWVALAERLAALDRKPTPAALYVPHARHLRAAGSMRPETRASWLEDERADAARRLERGAAERAERKRTEHADYRAWMDACLIERRAIVTEGLIDP